jgi:hypothetical protein
MRLSVIHYLFSLNAAQLYPQDYVEYPPVNHEPRGTAWDVGFFPEHLENLSKDLTAFLEDLHEFPQVVYEVSAAGFSLVLHCSDKVLENSA